MTIRISAWVTVAMILVIACGGETVDGLSSGIATPTPQPSFPRVIGFSRSDDAFTVSVAFARKLPYVDIRIEVEAGDDHGNRYKGSSRPSFSNPGIATYMPKDFKYAQKITVNIPGAAPLAELVLIGKTGAEVQFTLRPELEAGLPRIRPLETPAVEMNKDDRYYLASGPDVSLANFLTVRRVNDIRGEVANYRWQNYVTIEIENADFNAVSVRFPGAYVQRDDGTLVELSSTLGSTMRYNLATYCVSQQGESSNCDYEVMGQETLSVSVWFPKLATSIAALILPIRIDREVSRQV